MLIQYFNKGFKNKFTIVKGKINDIKGHITDINFDRTTPKTLTYKPETTEPPPPSAVGLCDVEGGCFAERRQRVDVSI